MPPLTAIVIVTAVLVLSCERSQDPSSIPAQEAPRSSESPKIDDSDLAAILRIPEPLIRVERVAAYLQRARTDQLDEIRHTFEHAVLNRGDLEYALMMEWWGRFSPRLAFEYTQSGKLRGEHPRLAATAVRTWGRMDPQAAVESGYLYDAQYLDGTLDGELLDALIVGWWESGKPGLADFIGGLTRAADMARATKSYARLLIFRDGARETLKAIPGMTELPDNHRRLVMAGALHIIAHDDPALAVEWLPIAESQGIDTRTFAMRIVGGWTHHDPHAATEWASSLPAGDERDRALTRVADDWQAKDPKGFLAWLDRQKVDQKLDFTRYMAIRASIYATPRDVDWPSLIERAKMIEQKEQRDRAFLWTLQAWNYLQPDKAPAWIDAHPGLLPPDQLARVAEFNPGDKHRIDQAIEEMARMESTEPLVSSY